MRHFVAAEAERDAPILPLVRPIHCVCSVFDPHHFVPAPPGRSVARLGALSSSLLVHLLAASVWIGFGPRSVNLLESASPIEVRLLQPEATSRSARSFAAPPAVTSFDRDRQAIAVAPATLAAPLAVPAPQPAIAAAPAALVAQPVSPLSPIASGLANAMPVTATAPAVSGPGKEAEPAHSPPPAPPPEPLIAARFDAAYLANPKPAYPLASRRMGESGVVRLRVQVSADGQTLQVEVKQSSGYPRLDQAAMEAVTGWRFIPARRGEMAVASWVLVPLNFALN